jgi:hypothetical protein|tara:strand:- start:1561 stop:1707 length:147 start_codon:yes stop_codon:yes gene_type:complete
LHLEPLHTQAARAHELLVEKNGGAIKQQRFKMTGYNAEKWILISKKIQ